MQIRDLKRVNALWRDIYPFLAAQAMELYGKREGDVLELGPFSGGIAIELASNYPGVNITIADERNEMLESFKSQVSECRLEKRIKVTQTNLDKLNFENETFNLVIFRGAFFFLPGTKTLLPEIYRVLKPGGLAFVGGGYGKDATKEAIEAIADESRILNDRLGRRRLSIEELQHLVDEAGMTPATRICEEGGVWLVINK